MCCNYLKYVNTIALVNIRGYAHSLYSRVTPDIDETDYTILCKDIGLSIPTIHTHFKPSELIDRMNHQQRKKNYSHQTHNIRFEVITRKSSIYNERDNRLMELWKCSDANQMENANNEFTMKSKHSAEKRRWKEAHIEKSACLLTTLFIHYMLFMAGECVCVCV